MMDQSAVPSHSELGRPFNVYITAVYLDRINHIYKRNRGLYFDWPSNGRFFERVTNNKSEGLPRKRVHRCQMISTPFSVVELAKAQHRN